MQDPILIPTSSIVISKRIRYDDTPEVLEHIAQLKESITRFGGHPGGLLQPIILDETNTLQDGWCRYTACVSLGWGTMPVYYRTKLSSADYEEVELETNLRRLGFTWQQTVQAVCKIHRTRRGWAATQGKKWTQQMTGDLLGGYSTTYVRNCIEIEPRLSDAKLSECQSLTDALRLLLREREDEAVALQTKRLVLQKVLVPTTIYTPGHEGLPTDGDVLALLTSSSPGTSTIATPTPLFNQTKDSTPQLVSLSNMLHIGDSVRTVLPNWPDEYIDHIISDPPYAISMDNLQQSTSLLDTSRVSTEHTIDENLQLFDLMFPLFYRLLRSGSFCVLWCDITHFEHLKLLARNAGFKVQSWPLHWRKTGKNKNQAPHLNTTKDYENAIVCRKGSATLPRPSLTSCIEAPNDAERLSNPFAKPFSVWKFLIETFTTPGQLLLDPFAGEGSSTLSALALGRRVQAVESTSHHYNYLVQQVKLWYESHFENVKFT